MGQIKNIKLHIVTDIKYSTSQATVQYGKYNKQSQWSTAKYGSPILVRTDLVPVNVVYVQTNMVLFASTDSVCADNVSESTPTISDSRSSSKKMTKKKKKVNMVKMEPGRQLILALL